MKLVEPTDRRRATILLMVVSILALLFVIVTGFISLARQERLSSTLVRGGNVVDRILDSTQDMVLSLMQRQWTPPGGPALTGDPNLAGTYSYEDVPGYRHSSFQAALDPVADVLDGTIDPNLKLDLPAQHDRVYTTRFPAVTDLVASTAPLQPRLLDLMLGREDTAGAAVFGKDEIVANARDAFMDADGDGVADALFVAMAPAIEAANQIAGIPVRAPRYMVNPTTGQIVPFRPSHLVTLLGGPQDAYYPPPGAWSPETYSLDDQWRLFRSLSRYEVAIRVVPHGGMLALDSPGSYSGASPWLTPNRTFATGMFNLLRRPGDPAMQPGAASTNAMFDALRSASASVEPLLRRRGGMLPSWAPLGAGPSGGRDATLARAPDVLRALEGASISGAGLPSFPRTFDYGIGAGGGVFGASSIASWQRVNLGDGTAAKSGLITWPPAARMNPARYNKTTPSDPLDLPSRYDVRHLLTTASFSDDLARRQRPDPTGALQLGLRRGQTKFYLGRIAQAFDAQGFFLGDPNPALPQGAGTRIVRELFAYYRDMLNGHEFDPNEVGVSADEQAWMLAVNTVAFAAPRRPGGFVDVVSALDLTGTKRYVGYGPQPFITQVSLNDDDDDDAKEDLSLLVELYNPNDPTDTSDPAGDAHALDLTQFRLTVNDGSPLIPDTFVDLGIETAGPGGGPPGSGAAPPWRLAGRRFMSVAINPGPFTGLPGVHVVRTTPAVPMTLGAADDVTVKLWRRNAQGAWFRVDEMYIDASSIKASAGQNKWHVNAWRDCNTELYFGPGAGFPKPTPLDPKAPGMPDARWRAVVGTGDPSAAGLGYRSSDGTGAAGPPGVSTEEPDVDPSGIARFGPTIPLPAMNAMPLAPQDRNTRVVVHGSRRPESFPTVGFLAFVPRFSHVIEGTVSKPMGRVIEDHWIARGLGTSAPLIYPADVGHMPFFDNSQDSESKSIFAATGKLPWGQLVFDYFTTVNPAGQDDQPGTADDVDPLRIPGRINVNAAPWFVLANLPVIDQAALLAQFSAGPASGASPAFWSAGSGLLFGLDRDPSGARHRFLGADPLSGLLAAPRDRSLPWTSGEPLLPTRLGPWLGQAIAAYRDGLRYVSSVPSAEPAYAYGGAYLRNGIDPAKGVTAQYRAPLYGKLRGEPAIAGSASPEQFGLLTLGELVNVIGFDSSPPPQPPAPPAGYTDPSQTLGVGPTPATPRHGDYLKAVSLLALLDAHHLTTRSNTFTVYVSVTDREQPQSSVRSQLTIDRGNLLPRLVETLDLASPFATLEGDSRPSFLADRRAGYLNARYDD